MSMGIPTSGVRVATEHFWPLWHPVRFPLNSVFRGSASYNRFGDEAEVGERPGNVRSPPILMKKPAERFRAGETRNSFHERPSIEIGFTVLGVFELTFYKASSNY